jgi:hypothetical protein
MTTWYQQALTPPDVLEVNIRIGVIPQEDHVQALVELKDPTTDILLGQWSYPHRTMRDLEIVIKSCASVARQALEDHVEPF